MSVIYVTSDKSRAGKTAVSVGLSQSLKDSGSSFCLIKPFAIRDHGHFGQNEINVLKKVNGRAVDEELNWPLILTSDSDQYEKMLDAASDIISQSSNKKLTSKALGINFGQFNAITVVPYDFDSDEEFIPSTSRFDRPLFYN